MKKLALLLFVAAVCYSTWQFCNLIYYCGYAAGQAEGCNDQSSSATL
jgi:hypothetical protein